MPNSITVMPVHYNLIFIHFLICIIETFFQDSILLEHMPPDGRIDIFIDLTIQGLQEFIFSEFRSDNGSDISQYRFFSSIDEEKKFVSSKSADPIIFPDGFLEDNRYFLKYLIPHSMSERIIDGFEIIYVDIEDGVGVFFGYLVEIFTIVESCQRILVYFMDMFQFRADNLAESPFFESLTDFEDLSIFRAHTAK